MGALLRLTAMLLPKNIELKMVETQDAGSRIRLKEKIQGIELDFGGADA